MRQNRAGPELGIVLAKALASNRSLVELKVDGNGLGLEGLCALCTSIAHRNDTLACFPKPENDATAAAHGASAHDKQSIADLLRDVAEVVGRNRQAFQERASSMGHGDGDGGPEFADHNSSRDNSSGDDNDDDGEDHADDDDNDDDDDEYRYDARRGAVAAPART